MQRKQNPRHIFDLLYRKKITEKSKLRIASSNKTPGVLLDPTRQMLVLRGRSSPDHSMNFYELIYQGLENYPLTGRKQLQAHFLLHYFNTSSAKCLFGLLKKLNRMHQAGFTVTVNWYYDLDDADMLEAGEDYNEMSKIDFQFIPIVG